MSASGAYAAAVLRRRLLMLAPLGVAVAGGAAFWTMLNRMQVGKFDPHDIGNPMLGKPIPDFNLPGLGSAAGFSSADLRAAAAKQPVVLNFFASYCIPCAEEAEMLDALKQQGVQIWGIAWEDDPAKTADFLSRYGNPFTRVASDRSGTTFINFGLYGVPESFVIGSTGHIAWHLAGPISPEIAEKGLFPALRRATS